MIDDDYTLDEGDTMPDAWWRLDGRVPLTVRERCSSIPGLPLLAYGPEFSGGVLSVYGPRYLDLGHLTFFNASRPWQATPNRAAFDALQAAHPDTFSTVIGRDGPTCVWLALRLTRLTDPITDTILAVHDQAMTATSPPRPGTTGPDHAPPTTATALRRQQRIRPDEPGPTTTPRSTREGTTHGRRNV